MTLHELQSLIYKIPKELNYYEVRFMSPYGNYRIASNIKADFNKNQILFTGVCINSEETNE